MFYTVLDSSSSLFEIQRCFFPSNIPPEHYGKYAFITLSDGNTYFIRICVKELQQDNICILDRAVVCSFPNVSSGLLSLSYDKVKIIPSISYIKNAHVELIFKSIWDLQKWNERKGLLKDLVKQILEIFVLANGVHLQLSDAPFINTINLHTIIVKSIGNFTAGKVVDTSKVFVDKVTCHERFKKCQCCEEDLPNLFGLGSPYTSLKELIESVQNRILQPSTLQLTSSVKALIIGPNGCGKKTLVEAVAWEYKAVIVSMDGAEVGRPLPGDTEKLIKDKFDEALLHCQEGLTILHILRIESMCMKEGRILSQFLHLLDSIPPTSPLLVLATTSRPHLLHQSIRSSARFHNRVIVNIPSETERSEMVSGFCGGLLSVENVSKIVEKTPGFVLGDVSLLVSRAKREIAMNPHGPGEDALYNALNNCIYHIEASAIRGELGVVKVEKTEVSELGGLEEVKTALVQSIHWPLLYPGAFRRLGIKRPSGVLLYGPPGCAKTSLARAMSSQANLTFLSVSAADLYSPYVGDAEITVTDLFRRARDAAPTLLFIDEIDALVGSRENDHRGAQERVLSTFLIEMDGIGVKAESVASREENECKVSVIAATNRPESVDPALLRPGRLDRLLYVPPPSPAGRLAILQVLTRRIPLSNCVDLNYIAEKTDFFSGADLKSLCQEAALQALQCDGMGAETVTHQHWLRALEEIPPSLTQQQVQWYNDFSFSV